MKLAHEKLPFTVWIPLEKDRAEKLVEGIQETMRKKKLYTPNPLNHMDNLNG